MSPAAGVGGASRSTRPAIQAAGSMKIISVRKPNSPARQPKSVVSIWPSGAESSAPSDPVAVIAPSTKLRDFAGTARAPTASEIAEAVQASAIPISTPPPSITPVMPSALENRPSPAT